MVTVASHPRSGSRSARRSFPVVVTKTPAVRCQVCKTTLAYRPGTHAGDVLTRHYQQQHPATPPR